MNEAKISNAAATASRKVDQYAEVAKDKLHAGINKAEETAQSLAGNTSGEVPMQKAVDAVMERADRLASCIRERPITSAVIMLGIGALLGSLIAGARSKR